VLDNPFAEFSRNVFILEILRITEIGIIANILFVTNNGLNKLFFREAGNTDGITFSNGFIFAARTAAAFDATVPGTPLATGAQVFGTDTYKQIIDYLFGEFLLPGFMRKIAENGYLPGITIVQSLMSSNLGMEAGFDLGFMGDVQLQTQTKKSSNLIQWMPVLSYWHPVNVQSAIRESTKLIWQLTNQEKQISFFAHTSWISTRDLVMEQALRYSPTRTSAMGITWIPEAYELNIQYDYVSERISMYGYPEHIILDAMELWSMSVARFWRSSYGSLTLILAGDNLANLRYETIKGYPEPGRTIRFTINYAR